MVTNGNAFTFYTSGKMYSYFIKWGKEKIYKHWRKKAELGNKFLDLANVRNKRHEPMLALEMTGKSIYKGVQESV